MADATNKPSLNEQIALKIVNYLTVDKQLSKVDYLKCKFAVESILMNTSKLIVVYTIAYLLNIIDKLFVFHIGYMLIRTFGYGAHARNSWSCLILSTIIFITSPYLIVKISSYNQLFYTLLSIIIILIVYVYAPSFTKKNRISNESKIKNLRFKAISISILILGYSLISNTEISHLLISGSFLGSLMLLPVSHFVFSGEWNN